MASLILLISISLVGLLGVESISADQQGNGASRIISVLGIGQVQGQAVIIDILVKVQPGQNANEVARDALQSQGARPFESANLGSKGFTLIGSEWNFFPVVQNYNPLNEPNSLSQMALTNTHDTWNGVSTSDFEINNLGPNSGTTNRCPSLIRECQGPQFFDTFNDVAWLKLRPNILGVAVFSGQEADMVLSTRVNWNFGCVDEANSIDIETVFLHENGHVVGLGHSDDEDSVLQSSYQGAACGLGDDDEEGVTFLYDNNILGSVSGTVLDADVAPVSGATVVLEDTSLSAMTAADGTYTISSVPDPVTYTVTASIDDASDTVLRVFVSGSVTGVDFTLDISDGGNGGGNCPPKSRSPNCP